ncbi:hypothetical protein HW555_012547 [Spodoptera exigua]|uniref:Uncharacterized protein n=1 Tax=Spodoptera exigua TaxID=7107 RepID=A0A835G5B9_SPOEX|nr:hypothetical protein HW555_012547 [Spodoptera exigua]
MIRKPNIQGRFYLSQNEEDTIYLDNCRVPQHHIEGIRFLYKQFKRKRNGVIINDPLGFGRNIQITLFLKAVHPLLSRPVLILCEEGSENDWYERFFTWTDLSDDVVIETKNPMLKKAVIINTMVNLHLFCARDWSIIIVDGDKVTSTNPLLKLPLRSSFKIWNTQINLKENLDRFEEVYKWMYPQESFDKNYFIANPDSAVDVIEKSILLDSFLEDILIRREDLNSSFEKYQREVMMPPPKTTTIMPSIHPTLNSPNTTITPVVGPAPPPPPPAPTPTVIITKKNKDATGTKIKRSKTKIDADTANKPYEPILPITTSITKVVSETPKTFETFDTNEDFSIENYKRKSKDNIVNNDKPIQIIEIDNRCDMKSYYEQGAESKSADKLEEMDTLVFGHDTFISKVSDHYKPGHAASDKKETEPHTILTCKPIGEQSTHKLYTDNKICSSTVTSSSRKIYDPSHHDPERDKKNDRASLLARDVDTAKVNLEELNKEMRDLGTRDNPDKVSKRQKTDSAPKSVITFEQYKTKSSLSNTQVSASGILGSGTEQVTNSLKRNNIDDKMKECEEKVSKKFKGSFLDSLF